MARGRTLIYLLNAYRAQSRLSLNAAHNALTRDSQVLALQSVQNWLWDDFDWPHLVVDRTIYLQAGQRFYAPPADIAIDRILSLAVRDGSEWSALTPGISDELYAATDSDAGQRDWPVRHWRISEDEQIEVWPVPSRNAETLDGALRVRGIRNLRPFVADSDICDLDDRLIVSFAAAEELAAQSPAKAQLMMQNANKRYVRLKGQLTITRSYRLFQKGRFDRTHRLLAPPWRPQ